MKLPRKHLWIIFAAGLMALAAACGGSGPTVTPSAASTQSAGTQAGAENPEPASAIPEGSSGDSSGGSSGSSSGSSSGTAVIVPELDRSRHNVPLEDILFDTFGTTSARFVPLSEISEELLLGLRDAIVPVDRPVYGGSDALPWLEDTNLILGYESGAEAFAYPINVLNFHEIVNDTIGGLPVLITYCPLCISGVVFSRDVDGQTLTFGNTSALYQSDLVMYDHQTGSYWFQVAGEAVVGTLTGSRLKPLPSATMPWGEWKALHPDTFLITGDERLGPIFAGSQYSRGFGSGFQDRINKGQFAFPVDEDKLDGRLPAGEIVLTVEVGGEATAFPLGIIGDGAVNAEVGGMPIVVFTTGGGRSVGAFSRTPVAGPASTAASSGQALTFDYREEDSAFVDRETGSTWDFAGRAQDGPLAGSHLDRVSTRRSFWFAVAISFPGIDIYNP